MNYDVAGYFVVVTNLLRRRERVNVQHITWVYYKEDEDKTTVCFCNGKVRYYLGNVVVALTQNCVVHTA